MKKKLSISLNKIEKNLLLFAIVCVLFSPLSAGAYMVNLTSHEGLSGGAWVEVTGDGTDAVTFDLGLANGTIADIGGFFFNLDTAANISSYVVNSLTDANNHFTTADVITAWTSAGTNMMNGTQINFDFGAEFGASGSGQKKGDIRAISFTVSGLPFLDIDDSNFGMRLTSFEESPGDNRDGSRKMIGGRESVPEPASALMIGLGLAGLAGIRRKKRD